MGWIAIEVPIDAWARRRGVETSRETMRRGEVVRRRAGIGSATREGSARRRRSTRRPREWFNGVINLMEDFMFGHVEWVW